MSTSKNKPFEIHIPSSPKETTNTLDSDDDGSPTWAEVSCPHCGGSICVIYRNAGFFFVNYVKFSTNKNLVVKQRRYQLYMAAVKKLYGPIVPGIREELPACVVQLIRHWFPDPDGKYANDFADPGPDLLKRTLGWIENAEDSLVPEAVKNFDRDEFARIKKRYIASKEETEVLDCKYKALVTLREQARAARNKFLADVKADRIELDEVTVPSPTPKKKRRRSQISTCVDSDSSSDSEE